MRASGLLKFILIFVHKIGVHIKYLKEDIKTENTFLVVIWLELIEENEHLYSLRLCMDLFTSMNLLVIENRFY